MERAGIENLVFSSSCTVYGEPQKVPIDESHPVGSVSSPYGRTKSMMEEIIKDFCSANSKFNASLLRYFNPVGADKSGLIGEDPNGIPDNLVPFVGNIYAGLHGEHLANSKIIDKITYLKYIKGILNI